MEKLKEETFKKKLQKEIELKNINFVNPKMHGIRRQVKGLPLTVFQIIIMQPISLICTWINS